MKHGWLAGGLIAAALMVSGTAWALALDPATEKLVNRFEENFSGVGSDPWSLSGAAVRQHGAYGGSVPVRLFSPDDIQAPGAWLIPWKSVNTKYEYMDGGEEKIVYDHEYITHLIANKPPEIGSALFGGGTFSGTAMWLTGTGVFQKNGAPATGWGHGFSFPDDSAPTVSNLGTYWNGSTGAAHTGGDTRGFGSATLTMPIVTGIETTKVFYLSQQVFVPDHTADGVDAGKVVGVGIYAEREGYGLFSPGGQHGQPMALSTDVWHLVEARVTITTHGGLTDAFTDDTGTMTVAYYLDGALFTSQTFNLADNSSFQRNGDIVLSWGDGLQRGWQGYVPEMYVTNMVFAEIVPVPEPATMTLLALGGLAILRRKR